ncbi:PREDICTED: uncharacterized protein LOC108557859 [Nicrophorus vespilloides]|uniref:Uncharacterized protein LOC108557859 n=1 Tax=Nicrophorus vespilloides TaxID=110193 RepID=A0ABM1M637_NICVS|nr:PREDICTED: uncharacterized protein LOC108557859 [Nicrophorus vespilloides]
MGCGHSKINIYPKRSRNKNCSKKSVIPEKCHNQVDQEGCANGEAESGICEKTDDADRKTIKVKPFGGPLLAHTELSTSQNNFFKMLDDKIESGADYDSGSEYERAMEQARLSSLLKDWETASSGSRSLPSTPKRRPPAKITRIAAAAAATAVASSDVQSQHHPNANPYIEQRIYNPHYYSSPSHYASAMQYQAISPIYPQNYYPPRQYGSPVKSYSSTTTASSATAAVSTSSSSPKHIPYDTQGYAPNHYVAPSQMRFTNGDLIQQQIYQQQLQYQQAKEFQQYKLSREQHLLKQQQQLQSGTRSFQSSVHIPIGPPPSELREQYELT